MYQKIRLAIFTFSMVIFPITFYYFSPAISLMGAADGIISGSLILFVFLFISSLFIGRIFCSWICPAGAMQDCVGKSRSKAVNIRKISWIKYLVWTPWLALVLFLFRRAGGIKGIDFFFQTTKGISLSRYEDSIIYGIIIIAFFGLSMAFGRRTACHTICWMSPFMILGKKLGSLLKLPSLNLEADSDHCVSCSRCTNVCPMSLPVEKLVSQGKIADVNCILCGKCLDSCKRNVIKFKWMAV